MLECSSCRRHYKTAEAECPFCATRRPTVPLLNLVGGAMTTMVLAACYGVGDGKFDTGHSGFPTPTDLTTDYTTTPPESVGDTGPIYSSTTATTGDTGAESDTGDPVDTGASPTGTDNDGDGYFTPWDCDDTNTLINPDYPEQCADSIDNDCDGLVDGADPQCP